jgi:hypothetical protein
MVLPPQRLSPSSKKVLRLQIGLESTNNFILNYILSRLVSMAQF